MKININKASVTDLQGIIHIGPKRAERIINKRPFRDLYELSIVLGLGKKRMNDIIAQDFATTKG
jgi:competence protein ComEC